MKSSGASKRYAQAAFQLGRDLGKLEAWAQGMQVLGALSEDAGFKLLMDSPRVPLAAKADMLRQYLPGVEPGVLNLAQLVVGRNRVDAIGGMVTEFQRLYDQARGVQHARVITAVPLSTDAKAALTRQLVQYTGAQVVVNEEVDPAIIGGLVVRIGDKLIDGSIKGQLEALHRQLTGAA